MAEAPVKIGVLIASLGTGDDHRALKFLILHQNTVQQSFEFQLLPDSDDPIIQELSFGETPNREEIEGGMPKFVAGYRQSLAQSEQDYDLQPTPSIPIVILSTATFIDNYYLTSGDNWAIIALGNWQRVMAPPSIYEFFLSILVGLSIDFACGDDYPRSHITTKGCCSDFSAQLEDTRLSILSGFICSDCLAAIQAAHSEQLAKDAQTLLQKRWLGTVAEPSDAAVMAKKLGYDLFHTTGITPTWWERTRATLEKEVVRTILTILGVVAGAAFVVYLGL